MGISHATADAADPACSISTSPACEKPGALTICPVYISHHLSAAETSKAL